MLPNETLLIEVFMFILCTVEDSVSIAPQFFNNELEAVEIELLKKFANFVLKGVGLVVSVYSIDEIQNGFIFPSFGSCFCKVSTSTQHAYSTATHN